MTKSSSRSPTEAKDAAHGGTHSAVRRANEADLPALAKIQTATWQTTYRGLVPDAFLDDAVPGLLRRHWAALPGEDWRVLVTEVGGAVRGFVALDLAHEGGPYIDNLHVAPGAQGQGLGLRLLAAAAEAALPSGRLALTVMAGNAQARRFYTRAGGREGGIVQEALFGTPVTAIPVTWSGPALTVLSRGAAEPAP